MEDREKPLWSSHPGSHQEPVGLLSRVLGREGLHLPTARPRFTGCSYTAFLQERSSGAEAWEKKGRPGNLAGRERFYRPSHLGFPVVSWHGASVVPAEPLWLMCSLLVPSHVPGCCRVPGQALAMLHVLGPRKAALPSQLPKPMLGSRACRAGPHQLVVLFGQQQNAAHIGLVVVERVELWGGHMEGPSLWEAIVQLLIEREQVHIVHGDVVCAVAALQEAHIDECCPIEPMQEKQG